MTVLTLIRDLANEGKTVWFSSDFGGNSLTVFVKSKDGTEHTHVGQDDTSVENLEYHLIAVLKGFLNENTKRRKA